MKYRIGLFRSFTQLREKAAGQRLRALANVGFLASQRKCRVIAREYLIFNQKIRYIGLLELVLLPCDRPRDNKFNIGLPVGFAPSLGIVGCDINT